MSDRKSRFLRDNCFLKLCSEYGVKKIEAKLLGDPNWVTYKELNFKKWFRKKRNELNNLDDSGEVPRVVCQFAQISGDHLLQAIKHWVELLIETDQFIDLGTLPNCPDILKGKLVLIIGDDSSQGHTR